MKIVKLGLERHPGRMYYFHEGDLWSVPRVTPGQKEKPPKRVAKLGLEQDPRGMYHLDRDGDVAVAERQQGGAIPEHRTIKAMLKKQLAAWNRSDLEGFMAGYAPRESLVYVSGATVIRGWGALREHYRKTYGKAKLPALTLEVLDIHLPGQGSACAIVLARFKVGKVKGHCTLALEHWSEGVWKIVHDHTQAA